MTATNQFSDLLGNNPESSTVPSPPIKKRYFTRGRILRRLLLLFGIYLGMCAAIAWVSVSPRRSKLLTTPASVKIPFESVSFHSADGTKLAGWYLPPSGKPKGVIVLCHGVDGNREDVLAPAAILHKHGYATMLFDFRARGESEGGHSTLGWKETDDLLAAIALVKSRPELKDVPIGLMGHSTGGAAVLMGASRCPDVRAVIAESPFAQLDHAVDNHFSQVFGRMRLIFEVPSRWFGERLIGRSAAEISPVTDISRIAPRPVLLIEDAEDRLCPPSETHALYEACIEPKSIWTVPGAGHIQAINVQPKEFERRITAFLDENLMPKPAKQILIAD